MMEKGWIASTVADMRRAPDVQSERVSQLLIFSPIEILEENQDWALCPWSGWVQRMGQKGLCQNRDANSTEVEGGHSLGSG
jgi:hypothetical protein